MRPHKTPQEGAGYDGKEISAQYFDESVLRIVSGKLSPRQYVALWDQGKLKFQIKEALKPKYLPSRQQVARYLKSLS